MTRSAERTGRWVRALVGFSADLVLYTGVGLVLWLAIPAIALGWQPIMITSGSMSPAVEPGDVLLIERGVPENGEWFVPGTIITYEDTRPATGDEPAETRLVTHRVNNINADGEYVTRGDANASVDQRPVASDQVVGAARLLLPWVGLPIHWARQGRFIELTTFVLVLIAAIMASRLEDDEELDRLERVRQQELARQRRPNGLDPLTLGARAARTARANPSSGRLRPPPTLDDQEVVQPRRQAAGLPPVGAILVVVALAIGGFIPAAQAAFSDETANTGNSFSTAASPFEVDVTITNDWGQGYCADVTVSTTSSTPLTWEVDIDLSTPPLTTDGGPYEVWNASSTFDDPVLTASGAGWNDTVVAGSPVTWGFCTNRPWPEVGDVDHEVEIYTDWGDGYCAWLNITTGSEDLIAWQVEVDLSTFPTDGVVYDGPDYHDWSYDPATQTLSTSSTVGQWWQLVSADQPYEETFWFCADRTDDPPPSPSDPPSMVLPSFVDEDGTEVDVIDSGRNPGQARTYTFAFTYDQPIVLDGVVAAQLLVQRDAPGNSRGSIDVTLRADGTPIAAGSTTVAGNGWQTVIFDLDDLGPIDATYPADTTFEVELELRRVRVDVGSGGSEILLPLAD